jgi:hypothetical protein
VSHTKEPALKVRPRASALQVPKQQEEDLLNDVFSLTDRKTAGIHVPKQRVAKPVEQDKDVLLESGLFKNLAWRARRERRQAQCGL